MKLLTKVRGQHNKKHKKKKSVIKNSTTKKSVTGTKKIYKTLSALKQHNKCIRINKLLEVKDKKKQLNNCDSPVIVLFVPTHETVDIASLAHSICLYILLELLSESTINNQQFNYEWQSFLSNTANPLSVILPLPKWANKNLYVHLLFMKPFSSNSKESQMTDIISYLDIAKTADYIIPCFGDFKDTQVGFNDASNEFFSLLLQQGIPDVISLATLTNYNESLLQYSSNAKQFNLEYQNIVRSSYTNFWNDKNVFDFRKAMHEYKKCNLNNDAVKSSEFIVIKNFFRKIGSASIGALNWRETFRGYMLCNEFAQINEETFECSGYSKGLGFCSKYPIHITGIGDFYIKQILISGKETNHQAVLVDQLEDTTIISRIWDSLNTDNNNNIIEEDTMNNTDDNKIDVDNLNNYKAMDENIFFENTTLNCKSDFEHNDNMDDEDFVKSELTDYSMSNTDFANSTDVYTDHEYNDETLDNSSDYFKAGNYQIRKWTEMEFDDEVDTPNDIPVSQRFYKYQNLKSFKTSIWQTTEHDLPDSYKNLHIFENYKSFVKKVFIKYRTSLLENQAQIRDQVVMKGLRKYKLIITSFNSIEISKLHAAMQNRNFLVLSTLTPIERIVNVQHYKIQKSVDAYNVCIPRKSECIVQCGFRRMNANCLWSHTKASMQQIPYTTSPKDTFKLKEDRYLKNDYNGTIIASTIGFTTNFITPTIIWYIGCKEKYMNEMDDIIDSQIDLESKSTINKPHYLQAFAHGHFFTTDPCKQIIKRILLTGYPQKISHKRCIVGKMFNNRSDVLVYKNCNLITKRKLVGKIREPVGLHGNMKCEFNNTIKHGDTVCLTLYKRANVYWYNKAFEEYAII